MAPKTPILLFLITLLLSSPCQADSRDEILAKMGTMSGQIFVDDKPVPNALVAFFDITKGLPPIGKGVARLPDFVDRADEEARFHRKLPGGQYYMGVIPRAADAPAGPPQPGEKFYFAHDGKRRLRKLSIEDRQLSDVGRIDAIRRPEVADNENIAYFTVEGKVVDGDTDIPYAGARVLAKKKPTHGKPDYFAPPTGSDGKFSLKLPVGVPLYLLAREQITGYKPGAGDKVGTYGLYSPAGAANKIMSSSSAEDSTLSVEERLDLSNTDHGLTVSGKKGDVISGIVIHMYAIPDHQEGQENMVKQDGSMFTDGVK